MEPFVAMHALAAPLLLDNVDTDLIIPKQFLKTLKRTGLGRHLFHDLRFEPDGRERPGFVLNQEAYRGAQILLAGANFGCGSSREHAPWALLDFGIRCVIAPSFADIFQGNCFQNGLLPVALPRDQVECLAQESGPLAVDLEAQVVRSSGRSYPFALDPGRKHALLQGLDPIGLTLEHRAAIAAWEAAWTAERVLPPPPLAGC